jgi:hypothetical protein
MAGTVGEGVEATVVVGALEVPVELELGVVAELELDFDELPPHAASTSDVATATEQLARRMPCCLAIERSDPSRCVESEADLVDVVRESGQLQILGGDLAAGQHGVAQPVHHRLPVPAAHEYYR